MKGAYFRSWLVPRRHLLELGETLHDGEAQANAPVPAEGFTKDCSPPLSRNTDLPPKSS